MIIYRLIDPIAHIHMPNIGVEYIPQQIQLQRLGSDITDSYELYRNKTNNFAHLTIESGKTGTFPLKYLPSYWNRRCIKISHFHNSAEHATFFVFQVSTVSYQPDAWNTKILYNHKLNQNRRSANAWPVSKLKYYSQTDTDTEIV